MFNSGTHVSELFVPLLHFKNAGFDFDFATGSEKGTVLVDRELITGDSPNAENNVAAVATPLPVAFAEKAKNKA